MFGQNDERIMRGEVVRGNNNESLELSKVNNLELLQSAYASQASLASGLLTQIEGMESLRDKPLNNKEDKTLMQQNVDFYVKFLLEAYTRVEALARRIEYLGVKPEIPEQLKVSYERLRQQQEKMRQKNK